MAGVTMLNGDFANVVTPAAGATEVAQNNLANSLVAYRPVAAGTRLWVSQPMSGPMRRRAEIGER